MSASSPAPESSLENVLCPGSTNNEKRTPGALVAEEAGSAPRPRTRIDVAALVLSTLALGGGVPFTSTGGSAHAATAATTVPPLADTTRQATLIAGLEDRLLVTNPVEKTPQPAPPRTETPVSAAVEYAKSKAMRQEALKVRGLGVRGSGGADDDGPVAVSSTTVPAVAGIAPLPSSTAGAEVAPAEAETQAPAVVVPPAVSMQQPSASVEGQGGNVGTDTAGKASSFAEKINSQPRKMPDSGDFVKFQEHTFTVTLPEFNLPAVGPITVPEEGSWVPSLQFSKVEPNPSLVPVGDVLEDALTRAASEGEVLKSRLLDMKPKQADFNR